MKLQFFKTMPLVMALAAACLFAVGCGSGDGEAGSGDGDAGGSTASLPEGLFLASAPEGVKPITELKESAKEGDEVVVRVVVGGAVEPMVDGRASALIVDAGLYNRCTSEDDHCTTPWDYCCATPEDKTANLATLQVVDDAGRPLASSLGPKVKPLSTLVVRGVVGPRADAQALPINATGIYVQTQGQ